ncbi:MAG: hypothetical protein GY722_08540 [bacterium]|nr:hypothetical protein [bacterium]
MNRTVIVRDTGKTPWELAFGRKPSISHLRTLFCRCYLKVPPPDLPPGSKVADQGVPAVHLGLSGSGYLVYVPKWNSIRSSANVTFDETHMPGLATTDRAFEGERPNQGQCERNDRGECDDDDDDDEPTHKDKPAEPTIAQRLSRPGRGTRANWVNEDHDGPTISENQVVEAALSAMAPSNHKDIESMPETLRKGWLKAEAEELANHESNGTFRAKVPITEVDAKSVVRSTWSYKEKIGEDGKPCRLKARLAAQDLKGIFRHQGKDFDTSFSSAMTTVGFKVLLALAAWSGHPIFQLDFTGAYLQKPVPIEKKIYVRAAPGYPERVMDKKGNMVEAVHELGKYMYGLQEAGAEWQEHLSSWHVNDYKATRSWVDPNIYYKDTSEGRIWIGVYVDDLLVVAPDKATYDKYVAALSTAFVFTDGGEAKHFLGASITRPEKHVVQLSHTGYIRRMKDNHQGGNNRPSTPATTDLKTLVADLERTKDDREVDPSVLRRYRGLVGALLYSTCAVRLDAAHAVGMLCRCMTYPDERAIQAARRVLDYLSSHDDLAVRFDGREGMVVEAFTDSDWDMPSTTGFIVRVCGGPVAWKSVKQKCIAMSSCEAELIAANAAGSECVYVKNLLTDLLGAEVASTGLRSHLSCDNQGTVSFAHHPVVMSRMKHVARDMLKLREWVMDKVFDMTYLPSKRNPADMLTKSLCPQQFEKLRGMLMERSKLNLNEDRK